MTPKTINEIISVSIAAGIQFAIVVLFREYIGPEALEEYLGIVLFSSFAVGVFMYNFFKRGG